MTPEELTAKIVAAWETAAENLRRGGRSLPDETAGLATGSNGRALYRLSVQEAARLAASAMLDS